MPRLKAILIPPLAALFASGLALADDKLPPNPARMEPLLREWENQNARLKTLEFSIYRIDRDPNGNEQHYEGHVAFKSPKLAYRDLRMVKMVPDDNKKMVPKLDTSKKRVSTPLDTTIWSGEELWQYRYATKQVFIFRLDKNLGLQQPEEAPLPLVFNVTVADARKRYDMVLLDESPKQHLLKITPKSQDDRSFSTAWIVLNAKPLLPTRILLLLPDKKSTKDFYLSEFQANQPVNESFFRVVAPGKPWTVERYPPSQAPARAKGPAARRHPEGQASRPLAPDVDPPR
jgi:TIGR03009 family protein